MHYDEFENAIQRAVDRASPAARRDFALETIELLRPAADAASARGGVLDVVLSGLFGIPLILYVVATSRLAGVPPRELGRAVTAVIHSRPSLYAAQLLIGFLCTVAGAYVAAWIAKRAHILNGFLSSLVCAAIGVYSIASGKDQGGALSHGLLFTLTFAAGIFGGYLRARSSTRRLEAEPAN